jgi:hypothetical protein
VGLADAPGLRKLQLYHGRTIDPSASLVEDFRPGEPIEAIKLVPVMAFGGMEEILNLADLGIVKIDVEGGEAEVINSMRFALQKFQPWLIVEILPCYTASNVVRLDRQRKIEEIMRAAGYAMFRILKTPRGSFLSLSELKEIGVHGRLELSDYVFCPQHDVPILARAVEITLDSAV